MTINKAHWKAVTKQKQSLQIRGLVGVGKNSFEQQRLIKI